MSTARAAEAVGCRLHAALYSMDSRTQSILKAQYASRLANHHTATSGKAISILFTGLKVHAYLWTSTYWGQVRQNLIR